MPQPISVLLAASLAFLPAFGNAQNRANPGPIAAEVFSVSDTPLPRVVRSTGTLVAFESVDLVPELSRRLTHIHVEEGSTVQAGDLLFELDASDLDAQLAELRAKLNLARTTAERSRNLLPQRAISQQEVDAALAEVAVLEAQLAVKEVEKSKTFLRAPFNGRLGSRRVSPGALVTPTTTLTSLQDLSRLKVDFTLPESHAAEITTGTSFQFTVAGRTESFQGKITVIEPTIDPSTRSLRLRGICEQPRELLPGTFAEISLQLNALQQGFAIPSQALIPSARGQGVYLLVDGKAEFRNVEIGTRTADQVQILRGLQPGDRVLTTNLLRLREGAEVQPIDS